MMPLTVESSRSMGDPGNGGPAIIGVDPVRERLLGLMHAHVPSSALAALAANDRTHARRELAGMLRSFARGAEGRRADGPEWSRAIEQLVRDLLGYGVIDSLITDPSVTEVLVNGDRRIYYERDGRLYEYGERVESAAQVRALIDRVLSPLGRRIDEQTPLVSARMSEGHRVHAAIPPVSIDGPTVTIRKFRARSYDLDGLIAEGALSNEVATLLRWAVRAKLSIAVSGGTGSGKTTMLNALASAIEPTERIVTIEDSAELRFDAHPHVVRLEAREPNVEGAGAVTIRDLVINSLRMRPDRIVVGEVRGAEALEMLQAMNTGHEGSMTTLHANAAAEVPARLVTMVSYGADLPLAQVHAQIASAIRLVVHLARGRDGVRRVMTVAALDATNGSCAARPLVEIAPGEAAPGEAAPTWRLIEVAWLLNEIVARGGATRSEVDRWARS